MSAPSYHSSTPSERSQLAGNLNSGYPFVMRRNNDEEPSTTRHGPFIAPRMNSRRIRASRIRATSDFVTTTRNQQADWVSHQNEQQRVAQSVDVGRARQTLPLSSMGAVPGSPPPVIKSEGDAVADPTGQSYRYGRFAKEAPKSTNTWTLHKWRETLGLSDFAPSSEVELEEWCYEASTRVHAHGTTAKIFMNVLHLISKHEYRQVLRAIFLEASSIRYLADVADHVVSFLFPSKRELLRLECRLLVPTRSPSVLLAYLKQEKERQFYNHMCSRRARDSIIHEEQVAEIFLRSIPLAVHREISREPGHFVMGTTELFNRAIFIEDYLNAFSTNDDFWEDEPLEVFAANQKPVMGPCKSCGADAGTHYRKDCPWNNFKCANCGIAGHISAACQTKIVKDTAGKNRILVEEKRTGADIRTRVDNTEPEQLKTMAQVVGKILKKGDVGRERSRAKYASKKQEEEAFSDKVRKPAPPPRMVMHQSETEEENDDGDADDSKNEQAIAYLDIFLESEPPASVSPLKHMKTTCQINGMSATVLLDIGAAGCCISSSEAKKLQLEIDPSQEPRQCRGVGRGSIAAAVSFPVSIELGDRVVFSRFNILETSIPILLSKGVLGELCLLIDPAQDVIYADGKIIECFHESVAESLPPSVLQQNVQTSVEECIKDKLAQIESKTIITSAEKSEIAAMLHSTSRLWFQPQAARCSVLEMDLPVLGRPRRLRSYPVPGHLVGEMNKQIDDLLALKLISPAPDCPWVSPCRLVPKPHSDPTKWRLVVDYRYVNTLLQDDGYALPRIDDMLKDLAGFKYFSLIDLNWGFWNVRLTEEAQQYTGFSVPGRGVFKWSVTPFGIKVSPTNFQRAMEMALRILIDLGIVKVFLDDIIIGSRTISEGILNFLRVAEALIEAGFFANFSKVILFQESATILGHLISFNSISADPNKIQGLIDCVEPASKKALRSFCAAANYLRSYIPDFSNLMSPLTDLTGKNARFEWSIAQQESFIAVKSALESAVTLTMPDFNKSFIIFADASELGVGAVLCQLTDDAEDLLFICFSSKKLNSTQRRWSPSERELYAIVWCCETYDSYIKGKRPLVFSDHKSLEYLLTVQAPKLQRWALRLMEYRPYVVHIDGDDNNIADWLSRSVSTDDEELPDSLFPPVSHLVYHFTAEDEFTLPTPEEMLTAVSYTHLTLPTKRIV